MYLHRDPLARVILRLIFRCFLLVGGAMLIGMAISSALQINSPEDRIAIVACCVAPAWLIGSQWLRARLYNEWAQMDEEEAREWDRAVNARRPDPRSTPESN